MSREEAARVVAVLLAAYPHARLMEQTSTVYEESLMDLNYALVERAVRALLLTERDFIPSIAKIRERAIEYRDGKKREGGDAYGDARKAVGRYGRDRGTEAMAHFTKLDPVLATVIDRLGWRDFCNSEAGDAIFRAHFIKLYDKLASSEQHDRQIAGVLPPAPDRRQLQGSTIRGLLEMTQPTDDQAPWEPEPSDRRRKVPR